MRVLCHAQHLTGVGHYVRMRAIACALAEAHQVHLVEGGRPVPRPPAAAEPAPVELPMIARDASGAIVGSDGVPDGTLLARRADLLTAAAERIRPDVVLVDHYPFSKWELEAEIEAAIVTARRVVPGSRAVCSLRDIAPRTRYESAGASGNAQYDDEVLRRLNRFDAVLVHTDPEFTVLGDHFSAGAQIPCPVHYTGVVIDQLVSAPEPWPQPYAVLSTGGLGAAELVPIALDAWVALQRAGTIPPMPLHVFAPSDVDLPADVPVHTHGFSPEFDSRLNDAALSISRGGYNTVAAILRSRVPAVVVPDPLVSDQRARAAALARLGLATVVDAGARAPDAGEVASAIAHAWAAGPPRHTLSLDGARVTGRLLERLVGDGR